MTQLYPDHILPREEVQFQIDAISSRYLNRTYILPMSDREQQLAKDEFLDTVLTDDLDGIFIIKEQFPMNGSSRSPVLFKVYIATHTLSTS